MQSLECNPLAETGSPYEKIKTLGQGAFGFVQLAKSQSGEGEGEGELVAIKVKKQIWWRSMH
jgi:hypothetical protein